MKIFVITKRTGILLIACALLMTSLLYIGRNEAMTVSSTKRDLPIYCVQKPENEKIVALSFDAAWGNEDTGQLIEIMDKYKVKTTFFVVGSWVDKYPESVKQLHDAGHEIMNHSNSHPHMTQISVEKMKEEVAKCDEKIKSITGVQPTLFRAPYGDYNNDVVGAMREIGHFTIQWDVDSLDWKNLTASEISDRVLKKVKPGSIVLFHNAALHTPEALPTIIENLQKDGYKIVPVSEIILKEKFTIDSTGMQIPDKKENTVPNTDSQKPDENKKEPGQKAQPTSSSADIMI